MLRGIFKKTKRAAGPALMTLLLISVLCVPGFARSKMSHVGIVISRDMKPYEKAVEGIREALSSAENPFKIDLYSLEGDMQKGEEIASQIKERQPVLVFTVGTEAARAIAGTIGNIPLIMSMVYDPLGDAQLKLHRDNNIFGVPLKVPLEQKFAVIERLIPSVKRLAIMDLVENGSSVFAEAEKAARGTRITVHPVKLQSPRDLEDALEQILRQTDALVMSLNRKLYNKTSSKNLLLFSARNTFPVIAFSENYVKAGGLLSVTADFYENGRMAGMRGLSVFAGEKIAEPFAFEGRYKVAWNKSTAAALGLRLDRKREKEIDRFY